MSKQGNKAVIGAFVVGAIVLAVVGILAFGSGALFRDTDTYVMYFDGDLKGLNVGAPVAFRGVRIGQVTNISVYVEPETLKFTVPVIVEIDPNRIHDIGPRSVEEGSEESLKALIDKGLRAQLSLQSIVTGQLMIQMDIFPDQPARIRGNGDIREIPTIPSSFERLAQAIEEISFKQLVDNINQAVAQFGSMLDNQELENVLTSIQTAADEIAILAKNLNDETIPLMQSLKRTADGTGALVQDVNRQVDPVAADARKTLAAIQKAMDQADQTLKSLDTLAAGYTERSAFRYEVSNALREIAAAASSLRALADMLQQQPDALIRGKGNPGGQ
jgi:paraquat-inducible protein B